MQLSSLTREIMSIRFARKVEKFKSIFKDRIGVKGMLTVSNPFEI
jgi:hypothetical protein